MLSNFSTKLTLVDTFISNLSGNTPLPLVYVVCTKVQFGHAGASAHGESETAIAKNKVHGTNLQIHSFGICIIL